MINSLSAFLPDENRSYLLSLLIPIILLSTTSHAQVFTADRIRMYWKDSSGMPFMTFERLRKEHPEAKFIINAGHFTHDFKPDGLYIENSQQLSPVKEILNPKINLETMPMGVFYISPQGAFIKPLRGKFNQKDVTFAIQSSPMMVINGRINPALPRGRHRLRSGVGILPDGKVYFALLDMELRLFAKHFLDKGCAQALCLNGEVSDVWTDGQSRKKYSRFGPMIVVE
jgi:uncharacterized protein YigE (DUF2233 family)